MRRRQTKDRLPLQVELSISEIDYLGLFTIIQPNNTDRYQLEREVLVVADDSTQVGPDW